MPNAWFQRDQKPLKVSKIKELFKGTKRYQRVPKGKKNGKKDNFCRDATKME